MGRHAQVAQRLGESLAAAVAARERLVDARREHHLGRDLAHALRHAHLIAAHAQPLHPPRVDRVREPVLPL
jgi:hypothetical protein